MRSRFTKVVYLVYYSLLPEPRYSMEFRIIGEVLKLGQTWTQQRGEIIYEEQMLGSQKMEYMRFSVN